MGKCLECGKGCAIFCDDCSAATCWEHRHDYGTHHAAEFEVGQTVNWNGHPFLITQAYADKFRWKYDGFFLRPDGSASEFACGVWASDLLKPQRVACTPLPA
jgi:hypothetical protein